MASKRGNSMNVIRTDKPNKQMLRLKCERVRLRRVTKSNNDNCCEQQKKSKNKKFGLADR